MKFNHIKHIIAYFLLVIFLFVKVLGLHAISHSDSDKHHDNCVICNHAITHNLTPTLFPDTIDVQLEDIPILIPSNIVYNYRCVILSSNMARALFSRPPPVLLNYLFFTCYA
ncbi:hypothetical protein [Algibacter pacificus]|uniref:hypothetical protein n=1 Tax=Algibacter pacificus TaxID=2599389 RepID=UPI0011C8567A|nr:hypothetical protein [Algibacter pacificus]